MSIHFRELLKPGTNYEFIGKRRLFLTISLLLTMGSIGMLFVNHAVRGSMLNWTIDFKGGTEIILALEDPKAGAGDIRKALQASGHDGVDVSSFSVKDPATGKVLNAYIVRLPEFGAVKKADSDKLANELAAKFEDREIAKSRWSGDTLHVRSTKPITSEEFHAFFAGSEPKLEIREIEQGTQKEGAAAAQFTEYNYEVGVYGLDRAVQNSLQDKLGTPVSIKQVDGVGAKAGKELRNDGIKSLLYAIALIMLYVAFRFDFRYGPGTVAALLHDAIVVVGVFAVTWTEFSLTTVAAVLTVIGYSMNDTIVVFDRIRENEGRLKDKKLDRVINISINETLSRTILLSLATFSTTFAMNLLGTGLVKNFAFAMNVGIIVGTYSSVFIAAPILLILHERYFSKRPATSRRQRPMSETPAESA